MTTQEYCAALEQALSPMPPEERQETIRYYLEFLEDANESERAALGTPTELAQRILRENGLSAAAPFPENPPNSCWPVTKETLFSPYILSMYR